MPSGSHGGSPGSHSSGGASSGGRSSGGSHQGGGGPRRGGGMHHPMNGGPRFRWGRTVYVIPSEKASIIGILFILFFFLLVFSISWGIDLSQANKDVKAIETDYYYYQDMITNAEKNPDYLKTGYVTDHFLNEDCDKWYFTYKIALDGSGNAWLDGYSYSCYTREEIKNIPIDSEIQIAVNTKVVTDSTDSIPMNYKNMSLKKDGEYLQCIKSRNINIVLLVVSGVAFVAIIVANIVIVIKYKEKVSESNTKTNSSRASYSKSESAKHCSYCGAVVSSNAKNCSSCGARLK